MIRYVYVAGAFTGDVEGNCARAIAAAEELDRAGFVPFVPHLLRAWEQQIPRSYEQQMRLCFAWVGRCDALVRLPGASPGADREVDYARRLGLPVFAGVEQLLQEAR